LDVATLLDCIEQHQPDSLILVPEILKALVVATECGWRPPSSLHFVAVGGGKVATELLRRARFAGLPAFEGYGLSECASVVTLNVPDANHSGSVGRPLPHVRVDIEDGEIVVTGSAFLGYVGQPDTWESGPVHTGDIDHIDDEGFVYVDGRAKSQLITSYGRNVSPEWVESELTATPILQQAVVFGDARPFCVALVHAREASTTDGEIDALIRSTNQRLPDYARIVEWRSVFQSDDVLGDVQKHSLGVGRSLSDRWAMEFYAIGTKSSGESISVDAYELEAKWQLTEQGEFTFDWGMVFEVERETSDDVWELSASLMSARDFGKWTAIANLGLIYEWGSGVADELETEFHLQARYRLKESLEPAIELHMGQDTVALGPALTGLQRLSPGKKFRWEAGVFWGVDSQSPDQTVKLNFELEF